MISTDLEENDSRKFIVDDVQTTQAKHLSFTEPVSPSKSSNKDEEGRGIDCFEYIFIISQLVAWSQE